MGYTEFNGYSSSGDWTVHLNCTYSRGANDNSSHVSITLSFNSPYSSYMYNYYAGQVYLEISCNGTTVRENFDLDMNFAANTWYQIGPTIGFDVAHNTDGTKSCTVSAHCQLGVSPDHLHVNPQTLTLDTIPRYANVSSTLSSRTMTGAVIKWTSDSYISEGCYYLDGSSTAKSITTNGSSGAFTLGNFSPGTAHNVRISLKRRDSGLPSETTLSFTTLAGASIASVPKWTLPVSGGNLSLNISNPGNAFIRLSVSAKVGSAIINNVINKSLSGILKGTTNIAFTESEIDKIYAASPNDSDGSYCIHILSYVSQTNADSNTSALSDISSSYNGFTIPNTYATRPAADTSCIDMHDNNHAYGYFAENNDTLFVQELSVIYGKISRAATAKKSASIASYRLTFNGTSKTMPVNKDYSWGYAPNAGTYPVTLTITDSRGFTCSVSKNITVFQYFKPEGILSLVRQNNFEEPTTLSFSGRYATVNGQNAISSVKYRFGETIAQRDTAQFIDITSKAAISSDGTISIQNYSVGSFNINTTYEFELQITDDKNISRIYRTLSQGVPILAVGTNGRVGINCLPLDGTALDKTTTQLQVNGKIQAHSFNGISGITDCPTTADSAYAASSKLTNTLNTNLTTLSATLNAIGKTLFPVGSIFFTAVNKNPGTFLGGTWAAWGTGRVPVGINTGDGNFNAAEKTGGTKTHSHTVNAHSHSTPSHRHSFTVGWYDWYAAAAGISAYSDAQKKFQPAANSGVTSSNIYGSNISLNGGFTTWANSSNMAIYSTSGDTAAANGGNTGSTSANTNSPSHLPPYITCYMWKRTA